MTTIPFIERDCVVTHEGRTFEASGAIVTPDIAIGYLHFPDGEFTGAKGEVRTWHGEPLGSAVITARWRLPLSCSLSSHMCQARCVIDGRTYTGRGCGHGMSWKGKPAK